MESWLTLIGAGGTAVTALALTVSRLRARHPLLTRATAQVLGAATHEAEQRGHRPLTVTHFALALLADPYIARELERRSVSLKELYAEVESLLPARADVPVKLSSADLDPALQALLTGSVRHRLSPRGPMGVLHALLRSEHERVRAVFERHGLTAERWPPASSPSLDAGSDATPAVDRGPYRGQPTTKAKTDVVFWNDKKTTQEFVTQILRGTFGILEPQATRLVLSVDQDGFAVVGTYDRDEAERLARAAMQLAKERGFPLKVSAEKPRRTSGMSLVERWWRRRR